MTGPDIKYLFEPRGIALIGASHNTAKIGYRLFQNILTSGYKGKLYPVNPEGGEIKGYPVYKQIAYLPDDVDVACIMIPAKLVYDAVKSCAVKGIKFCVIISSGFSEVGNAVEENRIIACAREYGMRILGPNVFGVYSAAASLNATFGHGTVRPGAVGVITQSGAIGVGMMGKTVTENIGLSAVVSVGNKADINEADLLEYLVAQQQTSVILMYIEGISEGERLIATLKKAVQKKPVIVIKAGRSAKGAMAAASHTSSLAGEDRVFDDIIRQCGVIRAETIQDALNWCHFLAHLPMPRGENTVIITNGGGVGVLAADACEKFNVNLYDDTASLAKTFGSVIPAFGSSKNPIDLSGQAVAEHYETALTAALAEDSIHSVICIACETAVFDQDRFSQVVRKLAPQYRSSKPLVFSFFGGAKMQQDLCEFQKEDIPTFQDVNEAASFLGAAYAYYRTCTKVPDTLPIAEIDAGKIAEIIRKARADKRSNLLSSEALAIMRIAGVPVPQSYTAHSMDEAVRYAQKIGFPITMKINSKDIIHKSESGGLAVNLKTLNEVMDAYEAILHNVRAYKPDARIEGIDINEYVRADIETIVGARRDHAFGTVVMFGQGGIYVEVMKDIAFRSFPLGRNEIINMISQVRAYPLLLGVRGEKRRDIETVAEIIYKVGLILHKCPDISDIEINPLVVYNQGEGVRSIDVRILLSPAQEAIK